MNMMGETEPENILKNEEEEAKIFFEDAEVRPTPTKTPWKTMQSQYQLMPTTKATSTVSMHTEKDPTPINTKKRRPFTVNEIENIKLRHNLLSVGSPTRGKEKYSVAS